MFPALRTLDWSKTRPVDQVFLWSNQHSWQASPLWRGMSNSLPLLYSYTTSTWTDMDTSNTVLHSYLAVMWSGDLMSSYLTVITLHSCSLTLTLTLTLVELTLTHRCSSLMMSPHRALRLTASPAHSNPHWQSVQSVHLCTPLYSLYSEHAQHMCTLYELLHLTLQTSDRLLALREIKKILTTPDILSLSLSLSLSLNNTQALCRASCDSRWYFLWCTNIGVCRLQSNTHLSATLTKYYIWRKYFSSDIITS